MKLKDIVINALLISAIVTISVFSAVFHIGMTGFSDSMCILMACLTLAVIIGVLAVSVMYKKQAVCLFIAVIYWICFLCYLRFFITGTTDIYSDTVIERIMLAMVFPSEAYMSLGGGAITLIITFLVATSATGCAIYNRRHGKNKT